MKKILSVILLTVILVILTACTASSTATVEPPTTQTPASTPTSLPPTPTALPPTPALDGLLLSGETLSTTTDGVPRYALSNAGWEPIAPEDLRDELANLEGWGYAQSEQGALQIVDLDGNFVWTEMNGVWIQLPPELRDGWQVINKGQNIVDANGKPLYVFSTEEDGKEGEWIKDYPRVDIMQYYENQLTMEDLAPGSTVDLFFERVRPEILAGIDWDIVEKDMMWANIQGTFSPRPDFDNDTVRYGNTETNAFIRDWKAFGEITVDGNRYLFMPLIMLDTDDQTIHFVKAAFPLQKDGVPLGSADLSWNIRYWKEEMNVTPLDYNARPVEAETDDPLFLNNLEGTPNRQRMTDITFTIVQALDKGDISTMDEIKDIIWMVKIRYSPKEVNWYR